MSSDREFMMRAVELASKCKPEERPSGIPPKVGVVVTLDGAPIAEAYRGDPAGGSGDHAEFIALEKKLAGRQLDGAVVYTTLEPCTSGRSDRKTPCTQWLIRRGVSRVYIGTLDPNPDILGRGFRALVEAGISVQVFDPDLQREIEALNRRFVEQFRPSADSRPRILKVGGVVWKLETLFGGSWTDRDPTTARVSTFQLIGENQGASSIHQVTGELETRAEKIVGQLNRDGFLEPAEALEAVPQSATIILVFPLRQDYWKDAVPLLDLPRLAPFKITVRVGEKVETVNFPPADVAELIASFIRRNEPKETPTVQWKGPPSLSKAREEMHASAARVTAVDAVRERGMLAILRLKNPAAAAELLERLLADEESA